MYIGLFHNSSTIRILMTFTRSLCHVRCSKFVFSIILAVFVLLAVVCCMVASGLQSRDIDSDSENRGNTTQAETPARSISIISAA